MTAGTGSSAARVVHTASGRRGNTTARPRCDICAILPGQGRKVITLSLVQTIIVDGRTTSRGAGAIDLCNACWERSCKPRMRAVRVNARRKAERESIKRIEIVALQAVA